MTLLAGGVQADVLYTVRTADDMLRAFDTQTRTFTDIGLLGVPFDFGDLGWDPGSQQMYLVQGFAGTGLYRVDLTTGAATLVGNHGSRDMFSLVYDPNTSTMYCGESTRNTRFFSIDLNSAALTQIGNPTISMDAMTYDPVRDQVVAAFAGPGDFYVMDVNTGVATLIHDGPFFNNCGMAYDADTDKYWLIDWSGNVYSYDPNAGYAQTLELSGLGAHDGFAAVTGGGRYNLRVTGPCPGILTLSWSNASRNRQQGVVFGQSDGQTTIPGGICQGTILGLAGNVRLVNTFGTGSSGSGSVNGRAGTAACGGRLQLVEAPSCNTSNVARIP